MGIPPLALKANQHIMGILAEPVQLGVNGYLFRTSFLPMVTGAMMETQGQESGRILVVDDEARNLNILTELLEDYDTETACSGDEALLKLETYNPDVVLLDIMMPGIDGYEVCRRIKVNPRYSFVKVVLVSGKAMVEERLAGYEAGADDYVTKPFNLDELLAKVKVFLRLKTVEEVDKVKKEVLEFMSHETLTPLNGIMGFSQIILDDKELSRDEILGLVTEITKNGHNLEELILKTLAICELKVGTAKRRDRTPIPEMLDDLIGALRDPAEAKQISMRLSSNEPVAVLTHVFLRDAFRYVMDHVIHRSKVGSEITFGAVERDEHVEVSFRTSTFIPPMQNEGFMPGPPMEAVDPEDRIRVLGLTIAKLAAEYHGGVLSVYSEIDTGTVFTFKLPISTQHINVTAH